MYYLEYFSSPELKTQVSFSDRLSSVFLSVRLYVRLSVCLSVCKLFLFFDFFSRTPGPISTKLGTKHTWLKGIQVSSNEGPRRFPCLLYTSDAADDMQCVDLGGRRIIKKHAPRWPRVD